MSHDKTKSVTKKKTDFLSAKTCETILSYGCFTFSQSCMDADFIEISFLWPSLKVECEMT